MRTAMRVFNATAAAVLIAFNPAPPAWGEAPKRLLRRGEHPAA